jgi:uncharacterized protein (DUF1697 family)
MPTFISLLRGINVSGQKQIRMDDLRLAYEKLGFTHVRNYVQSGNIIFNSAETDPVQLAEQIQAQIGRTFGFSTPVILRRVSELEVLLVNNPFLNDRQADLKSLHVTFLSTAPAESARTALKNPSTTSDEFFLAGHEVYVFCPDGYGRTKLNNTFFEKKLGVSATTRNWKTVNALYQMALDT